ncbi:MAG: hypothetical protein H6706_16295 [Myxococcales bacterium]|nr:hypothetical protein [Myxococcales bacterium]
MRVWPFTLLSTLLLAGCPDATSVTPIDDGRRDSGLPPLDFSVRDAEVDTGLAGFRDPCQANAECLSGFCIEVPGGRLCTQRCGDTPECQPDLVCSAVRNAGADITFLCVPDTNALCQPCEQDDDCDDPEDRCLDIGRGRYCGEDCTAKACPDGYTCTDTPVGRQCTPESGFCAGCVDMDGDGYGTGADCLGIDCDETSQVVNAGGTETCNGADDDCDFRVDEELEAPAGICITLGECARAAPICQQGAWDCRYPGSYEPDVEQSCDGLDNDCDGELDEGFGFETNPDHCGRCNNVCEFDNAIPSCEEGRCRMGPCRAGWIDLNGSPADGCEAECVFQSDDDPPDVANIDANCDGLDGYADRAVFVDALAGDDDFPGTQDQPLRTIAAGQQRAQAQGFDVYVSHGVYPETLTVVEGVSVFGGYDASEGWRRDAATETIVRGGTRALIGADIANPTVIQRLHLVAADNDAPGGSSYGVHLTRASGVVLEDCIVDAGRGADGRAGAAGDSGQSGPPGDGGQDAQDSANVFQDCDRRTGGEGGQLVCADGATHGGHGATGGRDDERGRDGDPGQPSLGAGGLGGLAAPRTPAAATPIPASPGQPGDGGASGNDGAPAAPPASSSTGSGGARRRRRRRWQPRRRRRRRRWRRRPGGAHSPSRPATWAAAAAVGRRRRRRRRHPRPRRWRRRGEHRGPAHRLQRHPAPQPLQRRPRRERRQRRARRRRRRRRHAWPGRPHQRRHRRRRLRRPRRRWRPRRSWRRGRRRPQRGHLPDRRQPPHPGRQLLLPGRRRRRGPEPRQPRRGRHHG